jgi:glycosyltransferase involved in cell wall biosynthesis
VLLYVGVLDRTHDLMPLLEAMVAHPDPSLQLHIVGDGILREAYESKRTACRDRLFFHGRMPHERIPEYVAAADLCLAPYDPAAFPGGEVAYSSLKIPEYLAAARPVVSVPSGNIPNLVKTGVSGFLFPNQPRDWLQFLQRLPSREILKQMGEEALRTTAFQEWEDTAREYLAICEEELLKTPKEESILSP